MTVRQENSPGPTSLGSIDRRVAERARLAHGDLTLERLVLAGGALPGLVRVHDGPAGRDAGREARAAGGTDRHPVRYHRLAVDALGSVALGVLRTVFQEYFHG